MSEPTSEDIARLKSKYRTVHLLESEGITVVVKGASREDVNMWKSRSAGLISGRTQDAAIANEQLFWACLVWPEREELEARIESLPLVADEFGKQVAKLAGDQAEVRVKKL